ncbi:MAG TPA: FG-GAP-like repeat-containing protein [Candidatus Binatia bacterium]|nr:FG-GAP-like repeat-containing protein [Candidatus Binatia bacterium]
MFRRKKASPLAGLLLALAILSPMAQAQFETRSVLPVGQVLPYSLAAGDFNRDGIPDVALVSSAGEIQILLGNGDGTFRIGSTYLVPFGFNLATASLRHNGILDLVVGVAGLADEVNVMLGNGDGTFQPAVPYPTTAQSTMLALGDFTGSGNLDVLNLEWSNSQGIVCNCVEVLPGNGDGTFGAPISTTPVPYDISGGAIATGDFNNDGKLDIAIFGAFFSTSKIDILLGNGDGTFTDDGYYILSGGGPITTGYFTADKTKVDLAVGNGSGVGVLLGNGDGTFQPPAYYETGGYSTWIIAQDLDGDGIVDLATSDAGGGPPAGASVFKGNGDGSFQAASFYPVGGRGSQANYIAAADFNNDGKPDLVAVATGGEQVITLLNTGSATFSPTSPLTFSGQLIGTTSAPQTVTITNSGTTAMTFSSVTASGAPFRMTANTCKGSLAPGAQCSITAEFTAKTLGAVSGGITINDSASSKPQFVELIGIGTEVAISPGRLIFPAQKVGTKSLPRTVHVTNTGTKNMGFTHFVYIDGGDYIDFAQTNDCGKFLAPKASCTVTVTFEPRQSGQLGSILYFNDDGGDTPQTVLVYGTGD